MKYFYILSKAIAGEALSDFEGRSPLEVSKIPTLHQLAKEGIVGQVQFVPRSMEACPEVALFSALGYNPAEHFCGLAPLEALAHNIPVSDSDVVFRCDLISVLDQKVMDIRANLISSKEAKVLIQDLQKKNLSDITTLHPGKGYKNFLVAHEPNRADAFLRTHCAPPMKVLQHLYSKNLPKGPEEDFLKDWMQKAALALEASDINRVRIDLGENPANSVWLWGQGRVPKLPLFQQKSQKKGFFVSSEDFVKGFSKLLGLKHRQDIMETPEEAEFVFIYHNAHEDMGVHKDLKSKIRQIEDLEQLVKKIVTSYPKDLVRVLVASDLVESIEKQAYLHDRVPFLIWGRSIAADENLLFSEKSASQSKSVYDQGEELLELFLGKVI